MAANPLILTLALNPEAEAYFTRLRTLHFPANRNFLRAHLTLFHHLPPTEAAVQELLAVTAANQAEIPLSVAGLRSLGRGVAFRIESDKLMQLHGRLQQRWLPFLTPQDKQKLAPHITIQNKVSAAEASALLAGLSPAFRPFVLTGTGLLLWEYLGGPWRLVQQFAFRKAGAE